MNLTDKYKPPVRYEDIEPGDRLIVTGIIEYPELDKRYDLSVGDIVTVNGVEICQPQGIGSCGNCPCRGICFTTKAISKYSYDNYGSSCWYRFKTQDGRRVV